MGISLEIKGLSKAYGDKPALESFSFDFFREFTEFPAPTAREKARCLILLRTI